MTHNSLVLDLSRGRMGWKLDMKGKIIVINSCKPLKLTIGDKLHTLSYKEVYKVVVC